jgi:class 3 adenylate cyclase/tetratricopeptide (TPR) repeat protein
MSILETVGRAKAHLEEHGRVSLRVLKREFELDDEALEELVAELVDIQQVAAREGKALAWVSPTTGAGTAQQSRAAEPERTPRDYTPNPLAEKVLRIKSALEGERKQVTVLFADVKGSMELAEQLDPEEWRGILERFFEILSEGVHRFEGTVNQYTGDGIMALFGAPIAHEDHAPRACFAALHLREELRRYGDELRLDRGISFAVRIGINSGEVIVGKIGDDLRMDYTAQGHTVGLAARMQQIAEPGKVYLTQHAARLVEGFFQLRDLGQPKVKGAAESLRVYELEGAGPSRTRLDVARLRGFSRFVGRGDEMATLELALHRAAEGDGQVVGVVGEAGVGKSRLCLEFVERCRAKGTPVYQAHCPTHSKTVPLLPILELLRDAFEITGQDRNQVARDKIAGRLLLLDEAFRDDLPLVFDFLGVPDAERPAPQIDADARQRQLSAFLRRLVQARSEREAAVLLFDDVHWIDAESDAFLAQLVEATGGTRTLLLMNFRPEYGAEWVGKSYYQQLPLSPLGPEAIQELLRELLGDDPSVAELPDLIRERTGGNPLFIEEVVHSLREGGTLEGARGSYRLVRPIRAVEIPTTVQPVLAARIDRLAEREKHVLSAAAVIGKKFPKAVIARVAELSEPDLAAALSHLRDAEFIYEETLYPEVEYAFKHPLTQEVAYDAQLSERRRQVHAAVARALEELHADQADEQAALLAEHWERAGDAIQAAVWHYHTAAWVGRSNPAESLQRARRMLSLLEYVPESAASLPLVLIACQSILGFGALVGIPRHEADAAFERGKAAAEAVEDPIHRANLDIYYSMAAGLDSVSGLKIAEEAWAVADRGEDPGARLFVGATRASRLLQAGRYRDSYDHTRRLTENPPEDLGIGSEYHGGQSPFVALLLQEGFLTTVLGDPARGLVRLEEALELAERRGELRNCREGTFAATIACVYLGHPVKAMAWAKRCLALVEREGTVPGLLQANDALWWGHMLARDWPNAARVLERMLELEERPSPVTRSRLAYACARLGNRQQALQLATEILEARFPEEPWFLRWQLVFNCGLALTYGGGAAQTERIDAALRASEEWVDREELKAMLPLVHSARAFLARVVGDEAGCERELVELRRVATEMGAPGWIDWCTRELEELESGV